MNAISQDDLFIFRLDRSFVPQEIEDKWKIHLEHFRLPFSSILEYVNSNILSIEMPSLTFEVVRQNTHYGKEIVYRGSKSPYDAYKRESSIVFKSTERNLFQLLIEDISLYHYGKSGVPHVGNMEVLYIDENRTAHAKAIINGIVLTGLDGLTFDNSKKEVATKTFKLPFNFNYIDKEYLLSYNNNNLSGDIIDEYSAKILPNDSSVPKTLDEEEGDIII
jgi:hypothetical protein